jgi:hypothetical protein
MRRPAPAERSLLWALELDDGLSREEPEGYARRTARARARLNLSQAHYALKQHGRARRQHELAEAERRQELVKRYRASSWAAYLHATGLEWRRWLKAKSSGAKKQ